MFQKGFVEFFAEKKDVEALYERIRNDGGGWVDFFAANAQVCLLPWIYAPDNTLTGFRVISKQMSRMVEEMP